MGPGLVWTGAEIDATTGIPSPDRPASRKSPLPTQLSRPTQVRTKKAISYAAKWLRSFRYWINGPYERS